MTRMIADRKFLLTTIVILLYTLASNAQVSNNMTLRSNWDPTNVPGNYNDIWGYTDDEGREYAIIGSSQNIHIVDVTDPDNVVEISRIPGGQSTIWRDFKTYKDRIYAVSDNTSEGLIIIDASDLPNSASVTYQSSEFFTQCHNIYIDENDGWIYVVGSNSRRNGLIVLDVSENLDDPQQIYSEDLPGGYIHDIYVQDRIAYASHGFTGLFVYDLTNINEVDLVASIQTNGFNHSSWLTDDCRHVIYAEEVPFGIDLGVIDVTNMKNGEIEIINTFKFPLLAPDHTDVTPHNPYIIDTTLVVSYYEDGTQVFNIADVQNPKPLAYYDTFNNSQYNGTDGNWGTYPYLPSGNIISSDVRTGLYVFTIDNYDLSSVDFVPTFEEVNIIGGDCLTPSSTLTAQTGLQTFQWIKDGIMLTDSVDQSIEVNEPGTYQVISYQGQCEVLSDPIIIPELVKMNDRIIASPTSDDYTWIHNGKIDSNLSGSEIMPSTSGYYSAIYQNEDQCFSSLDSIYFFADTSFRLQGLNGFDVFSNNSQIVALTDLDAIAPIEIMLFNAAGQLLDTQQLNNGFSRTEFNSTNLATGIYIISISSGGTIVSKKVYATSSN